MSKHKRKLGRKPNVPQQKSAGDTQVSAYGSFVPFLTIGGRKVTPTKPDAKQLRNWSRFNPVIRRCINLIKDRIVRHEGEFVKKNKDDPNDYSNIIKIFNGMLERPNLKDTRRTFLSAVCEDLVVGDCGCFEIAVSNNPLRPIFLYPTDGLTMNIVMADKTYGYAQRVSLDAVELPENYQFFLPDEIVYMSKQVFTNNPYGLSPIETAFEYIKALTQTFSYSSDVASNAIPKYIMNIKGVDDKVLTAYREYFMMECMGQPNLPIVSSEAVDSQQIAPISEEATFMQYQQFVIAIIALCFGVPPEKLAIAKSNDRSSIAEINENLLSDCIKPYLDPVVDGINRVIEIFGYSDKILYRPIFGDTLADQGTKQQMVLNRWKSDEITLDEMRGLLGDIPLGEPYGNLTITLYKAMVNRDYGINGMPKATQGGE